MNELLNTGFFSLLSDASQVTNEQTQNAYGSFMEQVKATVSQPETDCSEVFRMLNTTRIEFAALELIHRYGQGGKCPEIRIS